MKLPRRKFIKTGLIFVPSYLAGRKLIAQTPGINNAAYAGASGVVPAAGGGGFGAFSDDFAGSGALSGNWTVIDNAARVSDEMVSSTPFDLTLRGAAYTGTSCGSVVQYVKFTYSATSHSGSKVGAIFRYTDSSTPCYSLWVTTSDVTWSHLSTPTPGATVTAIQVELFVLPSAGDVIGATINATGNSTEVRVWYNPTGVPTTYDNWDGDTTPDVTFTDNPASAVDTGNYVGLIGRGSSGDCAWDAFFAGGLP